MFKHVEPEVGAGISFSFEGVPVRARPGETIAAALIASGYKNFRDTPEKGRPRGPLCMMGVCFDCLVILDGTPNQQACQIEVHEGMSVQRQRGAALISPDD
ncbi:MAG: sarcosine oxidase [Magnetovibrio sp.]|nr:sarcosine oxidase [Magnetovibrio sp.]|tara:strand:+ start:873 stop:1175 length:303 start_codon:yes stop_codon:yes gene_type:complete